MTTIGMGNERQTRAALANAIDQYRQEIVERWLEWVRADLAVSHVQSTDLKDGVEHYLRLVADTLRCGDSFERGAAQAWADVAREHALTRVRLGFDVEQLVHELFLLRRTVLRVLGNRGFALTGVAVAAITDVIDIAVATSIKSYVDARDYASRQVEAEHLGFLSHELRGPLSAASMSAETLARLGLPSERHERTLERIQRNFQRALDLADDVLLAERLEAGRIEYQPAEVTLGAVIDDIVDESRQAARSKGCQFTATYNPEERVTLDPKLTRSAVENLLTNAVKYTDSGTITMVVEDRPAEFAVHVRDSCPGLSEAELRIIFEPFRRGRTDKPGTGLGLSIARRAVEVQGGEIHAESASESGCHFWFTLPKRKS